MKLKYGRFHQVELWGLLNSFLYDNALLNKLFVYNEKLKI